MSIGFDYTYDHCGLLHAEYDIDFSGFIELTEFVLLLNIRTAEINTRIFNLSGELIMVVDNENLSGEQSSGSGPGSGPGSGISGSGAGSGSGPGSGAGPGTGVNKKGETLKRYLPPAEGILRMKIYDAVALKKKYKVMTAIEKEYIFNMGKESGKNIFDSFDFFLLLDLFDLFNYFLLSFRLIFVDEIYFT